MKRVWTFGALALGIAVFAASPAAGQAPPGHGLVQRSVTCLNSGQTFSVVETPGGGANVFVDGQHVVLRSISFARPGEPTFTKTFGTKAGLSTTLSCTFVEAGTTITAVVSPVPPGG
jgi:hypothetical protein